MSDFLLKNIVSAENLVNFTATDTAIVKNGIIMSGTDSGTGDVHNITIVAPNDASFTASYTLTMPVNDGNAGQVLTTDGSGVLSWGTDDPGIFTEDSNGGGITDHNIFGGTGAGSSLASGAVENFLAGVNAGNALTTGDSNICIGNTALLVGTDAIQNVAIGVGSLSSAVSINGANTNSRNVAIGHDSLLNVNGSAFSEGGYNVAIGDSTGATATTANSCILIGASANVSGATVGNEIVIGYGATGKGANTALIGNNSTTDVYIGQSSSGSPTNLVLIGDNNGATDYTIKIRAPTSVSFGANSELILPADVPVAGEVLKVTSIGSGVASLEWGQGDIWVIQSAYKKYKIVTNANTFGDENSNLLDQDASNWSNTSSRGNYIRGCLTSKIVDQNYQSFANAWGVMYKNTAGALSYAITVDLETSLTIERMIIGGVLGIGSGVDRPTGVKFEHSSDDASWTTLVDKSGLTGAGAGNGMWRAMFSIAATSDRYWRITLTANTNTWASVNDIELWGRNQPQTLETDL